MNSQVNCIAMYKCTQKIRARIKLDNLKSEPERGMRRRTENLIAISLRVTKSNNIVCTHYVKVVLHFCVCIIICCLGAMKIEGSIEDISNLFQNCDVYFGDVNANCDPEHVLNGNRRSH